MIEPTPPVAILMGSQSDWATLRHAADTLDSLAIAHDDRIISAHRTPDRLITFCKGARRAGYKIIIAGAGGAAHLPGMCASLTPLPVFGVPVESKALGGQDSLLSIVQMPAGVAVGTLAIGRGRDQRGAAAARCWPSTTGGQPPRCWRGASAAVDERPQENE
jgi:5-(carboxyamino)imidazole ribonucleotide mutase